MVIAVIIVLLILLAYAVFRVFYWKTIMAAYISYMVKNEYRQPSNEELNACVEFVTQNKVNDFLKRS